MPITYSIDPAQRLVLVTIRTPYTIADVQHVIPALLADPAYVRGMVGLIERRDADDVPTTAYVQQVVRLLKTYAAQLGPCKWALVVNQPASYGMGRMVGLQISDSGLMLNVFYTLDEARAWLGLDGHDLAAHTV